MNGVIKSGTPDIGKFVRPLRQPHGPENPTSGRLPLTEPGGLNETAEEHYSPSEIALRNMASENEQLVLALEKAKEEIDDTRKTAFDEGKKAGLADAVENDEKAIELLAKNCEKAQEKLAGELQSIESLAVLLAQTAVRKIVGDEQSLTGTVTSSILHHLKQLNDLSGIAVSVSAKDFPDDNKLAFLANKVGANRVEFFADSSLDRGDCQIRMRLGGKDIGINGQLATLDSIFQEMMGQE